MCKTRRTDSNRRDDDLIAEKRVFFFCAAFRWTSKSYYNWRCEYPPPHFPLYFLSVFSWVRKDISLTFWWVRVEIHALQSFLDGNHWKKTEQQQQQQEKNGIG